MKRLIYVLALLGGCATAPEPARGPEPAPPPEAQQLPAPPPERVPPPRAETTAVAGLMDSARANPPQAGYLTPRPRSSAPCASSRATRACGTSLRRCDSGSTTMARRKALRCARTRWPEAIRSCGG